MVKNILASVVAALIVVLVVLGLRAPVKSVPSTLGGAVETVRKTFGDGFDVSAGKTGTIEGNEIPFTMKGTFTVGTTSPVRAALENNTTKNLICDGDSLYVRSDAIAAFAPSFKYAVGTTTSAISSSPGSVGYSANLVASTTVATTTDTVLGIAAGWSFLLPIGSSITLSVGDYTAAIASSTYYSNWRGQFGIDCVALPVGL